MCSCRLAAAPYKFSRSHGGTADKCGGDGEGEHTALVMRCIDLFPIGTPNLPLANIPGLLPQNAARVKQFL